MNIYYVCPVHDDEVLFKEELLLKKSFGFTSLAEDVKECPKCKKHYYKSECNKKSSGKL